MLNKLQSTGERIIVFASVVWFGLFLAMAGCGRDGGTDTDGKIVVRNPQKSTSTSTPVPIADVTDVLSTAAHEVAVPVPETPRVVAYQDAEKAYLDRRYADAVELFSFYTESKTENPWGFYMLGLSEWKAGELEDATQAFTRALELDPNHVKSHLNLSRVLLDLRRPLEALEQIKEAVALDPESSVAYRLRGRGYHEIGQKPQAVDAYRRAIQIDSEDVWSMNNLGLILIEEQRYCEAVLPLARAVELKSDNTLFLNNLGMALEHMGHFRAAEEAYESAADINPFNEKVIANLNRVASVLEDPSLEPVDLATLAQHFVDEMATWNQTHVSDDAVETTGAVIAQEESASIEPETVVVSSEADSTGGEKEE